MSFLSQRSLVLDRYFSVVMLTKWNEEVSFIIHHDLLTIYDVNGRLSVLSSLPSSSLLSVTLTTPVSKRPTRHPNRTAFSSSLFLKSLLFSNGSRSDRRWRGSSSWRAESRRHWQPRGLTLSFAEMMRFRRLSSSVVSTRSLFPRIILWCMCDIQEAASSSRGASATRTKRYVEPLKMDIHNARLHMALITGDIISAETIAAVSFLSTF